MEYLQAGKILRIDLTNARVTTEPTSSYDRFIGGKAINIKLLFDNVTPEEDPFSPENSLIFGAGLLVGTGFPCACRTDIVGKSPVNGHYGDTGMGGYFGSELKYAGYDHLIIEGRAEKPVYLSIKDNQIEIKDASSIWGSDIYQTAALVRELEGDQQSKLVCIGPAGEKMVVYASIMSPTGNTAARMGLGAVMGSKNLKAIAVRGRQGLKIARPKEFYELCKETFQGILANPFLQSLKEGFTHFHDDELRILPFFLSGYWEGQEGFSEHDFMIKHLERRVGCFSCPVACFDAYNIKGVGSGTSKCAPPADATVNVRNTDMLLMWKEYSDCQRLGVDEKAVGNALQWLMLLHEAGIITAKDTDGLPMEWGSKEAIVSMAHKIAYREGVGDLLARGFPAAVKKFGAASEKFLYMAKGSPTLLHTPPFIGNTLSAAVSAVGDDGSTQQLQDSAAAFAIARDRLLKMGKKIGPDEENNIFLMVTQMLGLLLIEGAKKRNVDITGMGDPTSPKGKAIGVVMQEEGNGIDDIMGVCTFITMGIRDVFGKILTAGLGKETTLSDLENASYRLHNLERAFLAKCGMNRDYDVVSGGYYTKMQPGGVAMPDLAATRQQLEEMKDDYYRLREWDVKTGNPTREVLEKYDLRDIADALGL